MFKVLILLSGIFLGSPFNGSIASDPLFTSKEDCQEFLMTKDSDDQVNVIISTLKSRGISDIKIISKECVAKDQGA